MFNTYLKSGSKILSILLLLLVCSCKTVKSTDVKVNKNIKNGPYAIKLALEKRAVHSAPKFQFTDQFDSKDIGDNIKGLFFEGLPYNGKSTKVFCWYGEPENIDKNKKIPAVVLVHGGGGKAFLKWVKKWTDRGYIAISIALEGQVPGERIKDLEGKLQHPTFEFSGPKRQGFFQDVVTEDLENQWFFHAVADVLMAKNLLKSFPQVDETKIGITGISWGGILTNVITGIDDSFAFAIPVYGCGFLPETPHYRKLLSRLTKEQQDFYINNWQPSLYIPLHKQPTLFVNGTNDFHFTMNSFTKTFEVSKSEKYNFVKHNMKHGHYPGWNEEAIYAFANYVTKNDDNPQKIMLKNKIESTLTFSSSKEIESADS